MERESLLSQYSKSIKGVWYSQGKELRYQFDPMDDSYTSNLHVTILSIGAENIYKYRLYSKEGYILLQMYKTVYTIEVLTEQELRINGEQGIRVLLRTLEA